MTSYLLPPSNYDTMRDIEWLWLSHAEKLLCFVYLQEFLNWLEVWTDWEIILWFEVNFEFTAAMIVKLMTLKEKFRKENAQHYQEYLSLPIYISVLHRREKSWMITEQRTQMAWGWYQHVVWSTIDIMWSIWDHRTNSQWIGMILTVDHENLCYTPRVYCQTISKSTSGI